MIARRIRYDLRKINQQMYSKSYFLLLTIAIFIFLGYTMLVTTPPHSMQRLLKLRSTQRCTLTFEGGAPARTAF